MIAHNPNNVRIKRQYFVFLKEAKRQNAATTDGVTQALVTFSSVRKIFKQAFEAAGLPYGHLHSFWNMLVMLGTSYSKSPKEFKFWSQNLGHEGVLISLYSYGEVSEKESYLKVLWSAAQSHFTDPGNQPEFVHNSSYEAGNESPNAPIESNINSIGQRENDDQRTSDSLSSIYEALKSEMNIQSDAIKPVNEGAKMSYNSTIMKENSCRLGILKDLQPEKVNTGQQSLSEALHEQAGPKIHEYALAVVKCRDWQSCLLPAYNDSGQTLLSHFANEGIFLILAH